MSCSGHPRARGTLGRGIVVGEITARKRVARRVLSQREASERLGIGVQQAERFVRFWRRAVDAGLVSRQRGRPRNNRFAEDRRARTTKLPKRKYEGFGPTPATGKLKIVEGGTVSTEALRQMQIGLGLSRRRSAGAKRVFQLRPRAWFEGHGPRCTLASYGGV